MAAVGCTLASVAGGSWKPGDALQRAGPDRQRVPCRGSCKQLSGCSWAEDLLLLLFCCPNLAFEDGLGLDLCDGEV